MSTSIYIIAEAGVNHNGNSKLAFQLVDVAVQAGADAVKFQTFKAENLVTKKAGKAEYQKQTTQSNESQYAMLKRLELPFELHHELIKYCEQHGIEFLSTAFDQESLDFLVNDLGLKTLKLPSGEITNGPLLLAHAMTGCNLILSTGMASMGEVEEALGVLAFGLLHKKSSYIQPSRTAFQQAYRSAEGQALLKQKVTLLHCTTEYPAPMGEINLNAISTMNKSFGLQVGYSDHSEGVSVPTAAAALGAKVIEKHFTINRGLQGPDHKASLEPSELVEMVEAIRSVEMAMGDGVKGPTPSELKNREVARKSLVARYKIEIGERFTENNLVCKRPGTGISPMFYWEYLGNAAECDYDADEVVL